MANNSQYIKALTALIAFTLFATGCTKKRDAALPDEAQDAIFAISDIENLQSEQSQYKVTTESRAQTLSLADSSKATAEKGLVAVSDSDVPKRLKFMFKGLEISGQSDRSYPIVFSVDKQFVTAYKIVSDASELSILDRQLSKAKEEVTLQKQLQKAHNNGEVKSLMAKITEARNNRQTLVSNKKANNILVPIFKYKVASYGILQRAKNDLREDTSTLRMKTTDWSEATHIKLAITSADRLQVGLEPGSRGDLDRTFVNDRINNKLMTAGTLSSEYKIPVNMDASSRVLTLLDVDALHIFEVGQVDKLNLNDSQLQQLKVGARNSNVRQCSDEIVKALPEDAQKDCVLVLRYDVPVTYVRPELPVVDYDGNQSNALQFKKVRAADNLGLVQITEDVVPTKVEANNKMDPRTTVRVSDIKNKEFFFKRTLEDAPVTTTFAPGMAGNLTIVKFELEEARLVVRKADQLVDFKKGSNATDYEELMSIPVKYWKNEKKDSSGADYSMTRLAVASRQDAEYIELDWTKNTLSADESPYATISEGCIRGIADQQVADLDMRIEQGVLNFSYQYSAALSPSLQCLGLYRAANDYNGTASYQVTARLKERISFMVNDGKTDVSYVRQIPFAAQNAMGYGVWTIGKINPTNEGINGRNGQETSFNVVQDFRNGRVLTYTLTGLPTDDPEMRELYVETARDVVNAWDAAYHKVFKGSKEWERTGRYVEMQIAGENGVSAHVGDLDKNIIHFENKTNNNHGVLGVSQVGFNPRSGIIIADALVIYAGNLKKFVASYQRNTKISQDWTDQKEEFRKQALAELAKQAAAAKEGQEKGAAATPEQKAEAAASFAKQLKNMSQGKKMDPKAALKVKNLGVSASLVSAAVKQRQAVNGLGAFNYQSQKSEIGWVDRVLQKIRTTSDLDTLDLEGLVAQEMLDGLGSKISASEKANLQRRASLGVIRTKMKNQFKTTPGCMLTESDKLARGFTSKTYKQAMRDILSFDLGHEMGHSQGLTHNFIGSFDKANFANEDGTESKRNYSSIMDYFSPELFAWDGIGSYDIHALRASHLGLLEVNAAAKAELTKMSKLVMDKYVSIDTIRDIFATDVQKDGAGKVVKSEENWTEFNKRKVAKLLKPYMYCTDIHVGYEPNCQRFDSGTSATEIVENLIKDYENSYVNNYYAWGRLEFDASNSAHATAASFETMASMRQFMDELFYMMITKNGTQEQIQDYASASVKAYIFYSQLIRTPDINDSFLSADRFQAVPYKYNEVDAQGKATGKSITDVEIVEKRALEDISVSQYRLDTVGIEFDKIAAMNFLTMKGYPSYKYAANNIEFSYLDFEKYILGMKTEESPFVSTLTEMMLDKLQPTFTNDHAVMKGIPGLKATVTSSMRAYAGIFGILNLEASTLRDKDNFANLFKVAKSVGKAPADRMSLSQLGVSDKSATRVSYWALDNADAANAIMQVAAAKNFFIQKSADMQPLMEILVAAQFKDLLSATKVPQEIEDAKKALVAKLTELNKNGDIVSAEQLAANPGMTIAAQVENIAAINKAVLDLAASLIFKQQGAEAAVASLAEQTKDIAEQMPLFAVAQQALATASEKMGAAVSKQKGGEAFKEFGAAVAEMAETSTLDVSYGVIMKNLEFLSKLTAMTNPEFKP